MQVFGSPMGARARRELLQKKPRDKTCIVRYFLPAPSTTPEPPHTPPFLPCFPSSLPPPSLHSPRLDLSPPKHYHNTLIPLSHHTLHHVRSHPRISIPLHPACVATLWRCGGGRWLGSSVRFAACRCDGERITLGDKSRQFC
jgi:hypothetical protein